MQGNLKYDVDGIKIIREKDELFSKHCWHNENNNEK